MTEDFVKLNLDELDALKSALQLLSRKEQKLMESSGKVSLSALYNKLQSTVEHIQRTVVELAH
jgi:nicotinate-nucleotide pyrophosphorylase